MDFLLVVLAFFIFFKLDALESVFCVKKQTKETSSDFLTSRLIELANEIVAARREPTTKSIMSAKERQEELASLVDEIEKQKKTKCKVYSFPQRKAS